MSSGILLRSFFSKAQSNSTHSTKICGYCTYAEYFMESGVCSRIPYGTEHRFYRLALLRSGLLSTLISRQRTRSLSIKGACTIVARRLSLVSMDHDHELLKWYTFRRSFPGRLREEWAKPANHILLGSDSL